MRDFGDADREKKRARIQLPDNPDNLSAEALAHLESAVKAAGSGGSVACPAAWRLARDAGVSRLAVGARIDALGLRVTDCQLGCFRVGKTPAAGPASGAVESRLAHRVEALGEAKALTCASAFALAQELAIPPRAVADAANAGGHKLRQCQLGCF